MQLPYLKPTTGFMLILDQTPCGVPVSLHVTKNPLTCYTLATLVLLLFLKHDKLLFCLRPFIFEVVLP